MQILETCKRLCPEQLPIHIDPILLGKGVDGEVYGFDNDPYQVIKICWLSANSIEDIKVAYSNTIKVLGYLKRYRPAPYVQVYDYYSLNIDSQFLIYPDSILYCYTMEKLIRLTWDEEKVFHTILSHEDRIIKKNWSPEQLKEIINGLQRGLDFDAQRVTIFHDLLKKSPLQHLDIAPRNIMKDVSGNFKMIDLDRIQIGDFNVEKRVTTDQP